MATQAATPARDVPRYANRDESVDHDHDDNDNDEAAEESVAELPPSSAAPIAQNDPMRTPPRVNSRPGTAQSASSPFAAHLRLPPSSPMGAHGGHASTMTSQNGPFSPPMSSSVAATPFQPHPSASPIAHTHRDSRRDRDRDNRDDGVQSRSKSKTQTRSQSHSQSHDDDDNGDDGERQNSRSNNTNNRDRGHGGSRAASPVRATRSEVSTSASAAARPQPSVPATPVPGMAATGTTGETKDNNNNNNSKNNTTAAGEPSPLKPRRHIYPFSPKKARRADALTYPNAPVTDYDVEQQRNIPPPAPLIPNAWQLDFFRIFSILIGILILLPTVFHTKRHDSYSGTAYTTWQTVAMSLQIIGGAILVVTIISVSFAPTVYTRTIILGYTNALILWIAAGAFDLSRVQQYSDELIIWALSLEWIGLFAVYITLMILLYRGITGTVRHQPAALSAYERKELEIARAVINDLEDEKERAARKLTEIRQHWQGIAQTKQAIIEAKDQKLEDAMRAISELQSRCAALGERLQLLDPAAQKRQLTDARQQLMLQRDQADELASQLRRENGKLQDQADQGLRNQQALHQQIEQLSRKLADANNKYQAQLEANAQLERDKAAFLANHNGSEEQWQLRLAQMDDDRKKSAYAAANCVQCKKWEEKCDHLQKSSLDAAKHAERNLQYRKKIESLKKQLAILRRATALHHDFARDTASAVDDEVRDFRDFSTTLQRTTQMDLAASTQSLQPLPSSLPPLQVSVPQSLSSSVTLRR